MFNFFLFLLSFFVVISCSDNKADINLLEANGGAKYGGEFRFMSSEQITSLFPLATTDIYNQRITSQLFETLLKIDYNQNILIPNIAESYEISDDAKKITLKIREGIYFHDDDCFSNGKGRELTAKDVKYVLDFACSGLKINLMSWMLVDKIKGAKEYYSKSKNSLPSSGVSGIKVLNNKILIELTEPFVGFDKILTHSSLAIFPKEAFAKYKNNLLKHPVGTGPFILESISYKKVVLKRNKNYWKKDQFGNQLPFLEKIIMTYATDKKSELMAFRKRKIDLVLKIPVDEIENIIGSLEEAQAGLTVKHKIDSKNSLSVSYLGFAHNSAPFNDVKVRKAFNLGVDRNQIVNIDLMGGGYACEYGFIPNIDGYNFKSIKGHKFNLSQAKKLLVAAGYPEGKGFPVLDVFVNAKLGDAIFLLYNGIKKQLKQNLGVDINIKLCSIKERDKAIENGIAKMWRGGWIADYPDPENFLNLFLSKYIGSNSLNMNRFKYVSKDYDKLLNASMKEKNPKIRNEYFIQCDQMIIDDAVVMPLINDDFITMINSKFKNFETNSMELLDFSGIYIKEPKKKLDN
jgi:peptide/nickel transport system substrate-binding protein